MVLYETGICFDITKVTSCINEVTGIMVFIYNIH